MLIRVIKKYAQKKSGKPRSMHWVKKMKMMMMMMMMMNQIVGPNKVQGEDYYVGVLVLVEKGEEVVSLVEKISEVIEILVGEENKVFLVIFHFQ